jgi:long-chain acyl-CoA synthetase
MLMDTNKVIPQDYTTVSEMLEYLYHKYGDSKTAFLYKEDDEYKSINHKDLRQQVINIALAFMELGIHKGDRVGMVSENRLEWIISDLALASLGAISVPVFPILTAKQEEFIFDNCGAAAIIVSNKFQLNKVLEFKENVQSLRHVIVMDKKFDEETENQDNLFVKSFYSCSERASKIKDDKKKEEIYLKNINKIKDDDLLTIIYTSGTTGNPKGVMLTHRNILSNVKGAKKILTDLEKHTALSYLPLCHTYERMAGYYTLFSSGTKIAFAESVDAVASNIQDIKPTLISTVPKLMETIKKKIYLAMDREKPSKRKIFYKAMDTGKKYIQARLQGKNPIFLKMKYNFYDNLVYSKIRERLGGRMRLFISGGAALMDDVQEFFMIIGVEVLQGYGLTEASPVISLNHPDNVEIGSIGMPLPNIEVKLADDGEILAKGPNVMVGYWNDNVATQEAIDSEGWLHTGDIGVMTEKGNLKITDRKKNIFVSSGGKNIAPQPIENLLARSRYIEHAVLIGDNRDYVTALLTLEWEQVKKLAGEFDISFEDEQELISNKKIMQHIKSDIDFYQKDLAKFERVRRFQILSQPFSVENGELSPKMSLKRHVIEQKYQKLINDMYKQ